MSDTPHSSPNDGRDDDAIELPAPTVAPLVLALSIALLAAGVAMNLAPRRMPGSSSSGHIQVLVTTRCASRSW